MPRNQKTHEHSVRVLSPGRFGPIDPKHPEDGKFRTHTINPCVRVIVGKLPGESSTKVQSYRLDACCYSPAEVKTFVRRHKLRPQGIELASIPCDRRSKSYGKKAL